MAQARYKRGSRELAQLKVRLPELLRRELEREARRNGHSMNSEIVERLRNSFRYDQTTLIAKAVINGLDDAIVEEIVDIVMRERHEDSLADMQDDFREMADKK